MSELISFKKEVIELLKEADRKDIDLSCILKVREKLSVVDEDVTAKEVFDKLIKMFPEKKVHKQRKRLSESEYASHL
jgi:hypothetical protein